MNHHFIRKCRHCFVTVSQCSCPERDKEVRWTVCTAPACQAQEKAHQAAATRVDIGPVASLTIPELQAKVASANAVVVAGIERERQLLEEIERLKTHIAKLEARL